MVPPNHHVLDRCVKIVNLHEFPNIVLIGYYKEVMFGGYQTYQIENNKCLTKGYKANILKIYWNEKDKANLVEPDKLLTDQIDPYGRPIPNGNPLIKEIIEYSLGQTDNGKLFLYQSKKISEYSDGISPKIETFANPLKKTILREQKLYTLEISQSPRVILKKSNDQSRLKKLKNTFWHSIVCFFYRLMGESCR